MRELTIGNGVLIPVDPNDKREFGVNVMEYSNSDRNVFYFTSIALAMEADIPLQCVANWYATD